MSVSPTTSSSGAVFLSYAREDAGAVQRIAGALRAAGVEVWFDQNELVGGDAWDAKIRGQIASCALFVPVLSATTQARREGYFRLEWRLAAQRSLMMSERTAFLFPVVIDATRDAEADVPVEFKAVQWTRLAEGASTPQFCEHVARLLAPVRGAPASSPAVPRKADVTPPMSHARGADRRIPAAAWIAAVVLVISLGGGWWWRSAHAEAETRAPRSEKAAEKSIAVLPFVNLGADKGDEYLGDGMTEELLNVLAKVKGLRVPGRSSSFAFKGRTDEDIFRKVGEKLHVGTVLEGSVRKTGNKLRITAQLINVADGYHLWSETYDREMTDLLAIQEEVSLQVVKALRVTLGVEESRVLTKRATVNPEAHRLYLLGRHHLGKGNFTGSTNADRYFNEAIKLDPAYALAYCGLADNLGFFGGNVIPGREAWAREKELAEKALAIEPDLAEARFSLGLALADQFDWQGGEREMRRALELNPKVALAHDQLAWVLTNQGKFDEALLHSNQAVELDPLSPLIANDRAWWLYYARRYDESSLQARKATELEQGYAPSYAALGWCLVWKRDLAGALALFQKAKSLDPVPWWDGAVGYAYAASGERAKAHQLLRDLDELAKGRYVSPGVRVMIYLGLGEQEKALDWLDKCFEDQDGGTCWVLKVDPIFDGVRQLPRFQAMLKKAGLDR